jgi:5-methylcytosine-specific restriction protein B
MRKAGISDQIRNYVLEQIIIPARQREERTITFSARDIHEGMKLQNSFPLVCNAIDAHKFLDFASVIRVSRDGPKQSSTARWVFDLK